MGKIGEWFRNNLTLKQPEFRKTEDVRLSQEAEIMFRIIWRIQNDPDIVKRETLPDSSKDCFGGLMAAAFAKLMEIDETWKALDSTTAMQLWGNAAIMMFSMGFGEEV